MHVDKVIGCLNTAAQLYFLAVSLFSNCFVIYTLAPPARYKLNKHAYLKEFHWTHA